MQKQKAKLIHKLKIDNVAVFAAIYATGASEELSVRVRHKHVLEGSDKHVWRLTRSFSLEELRMLATVSGYVYAWTVEREFRARGRPPPDGIST